MDGERDEEDMSMLIGNVRSRLEALKVRANDRKNSPNLRHNVNQKQIEMLNENCKDLEGEQAIIISKKK